MTASASLAAGQGDPAGDPAGGGVGDVGEAAARAGVRRAVAPVVDGSRRCHSAHGPIVAGATRSHGATDCQVLVHVTCHAVRRCSPWPTCSRCPSVRGADPEVLAGAGSSDRQVRWVHTTELADIGPLLRGGDLVLTTGIALPDHDEALTRFVASLAESGAAGLVVELGRRWSTLPAALVDQCERRGLPLVALRREVRFAAVAQAVGERLVDEQLAELRAAERVHDTFTELSITEAGPAEILAAAQRLSGAAVVLETEQHRIVDYVAGPADRRRRRDVPRRLGTPLPQRPHVGTHRVGRQQRLAGHPRRPAGARLGPARHRRHHRPHPGLTAVAERAAAALAMHRLHDRTRDGQLRRVHHELLIGLLSDPANAETHRRAAIAGLPTTGAVRRPRAAAGTAPRSWTTWSRRACARPRWLARRPWPRSSTARSAPWSRCPRAGTPSARRTGGPSRSRPGCAAVVTAGSPVDELTSADRTLLEASQVLAALPPGEPAPGVRRLDDVHLRGLLTLLADDARLTAFADRELGRAARRSPSCSAPCARSSSTPASKSAAASSLNISRQVLYDRIAKFERLLGSSLDDAELRTSLHVALPRGRRPTLVLAVQREVRVLPGAGELARTKPDARRPDDLGDVRRRLAAPVPGDADGLTDLHERGLEQAVRSSRRRRTPSPADGCRPPRRFAAVDEDGGALGAADDLGVLEGAGEVEVVGRALLDPDRDAGPVDLGRVAERRTDRDGVHALDREVRRAERDVLLPRRLDRAGSSRRRCRRPAT